MLNPFSLDPKQIKAWRDTGSLPTWNELAWREQQRITRLALARARQWRVMRWMMPRASSIAFRLVWLHHPRQF